MQDLEGDEIHRKHGRSRVGWVFVDDQRPGMSSSIVAKFSIIWKRTREDPALEERLERREEC